MKNKNRIVMFLVAIVFMLTICAPINTYAKTQYVSSVRIVDKGDISVKLWAKFSYDGKSVSYYDYEYKVLKESNGYYAYVNVYKMASNELEFDITKSNGGRLTYYTIIATCDKYGNVEWSEE